MLGHTVLGQKEITGGGGEIQQTIRTQAVHQSRDGTKLMEIVPDGDEGDGQQQVLALGRVVLSYDGEHGLGELGPGHDAAVGTLVQEIQEAVGGMGGMAVMTAVREQTELAVEKDDGIAGLEKVLGRGGATGTSGEVVDEADGLLL